MPIVDYDCVINFQTIQWIYFDVSADFDLADHTDYDVHVSLLYDVGTEDPLEFKGMRTGFPAARDTRIGVINPPASPRLFSEERLGEPSVVGSTKFDGRVDVLVSESNRGVQNKVLLQNTTGIATIDLPDTPIDIGSELIADPNILIDGIQGIYAGRPQPTAAVIDTEDSFDLRSFFTISNDIVVDYEARKVSGNIYLSYDTSSVHIANAYTEADGWEPDIIITGINTPEDSVSPLVVSVYFESGADGLVPILNAASLGIYVFCNPKFVSPSYDAYRWIKIDYSFGQYNWRNDTAQPFTQLGWCTTTNLMPSYLPKKSVRVHRMVVEDDVYTYITDINALSIGSKPLVRTFGTVRSLVRRDKIWAYLPLAISTVRADMPALVGSASSSCAIYVEQDDTSIAVVKSTYSTVSSGTPIQIWWED